MCCQVAIDSNALTYLTEALAPDYDPSLDITNLANERVAILRIKIYGGVSFYLTPTTRKEYGKIRERAKHLDHIETAFIFPKWLPEEPNSAAIEMRAKQYYGYFNKKNDCKIVAEAEVNNMDILLTCDENLIKRLCGHTSKLIIQKPSVFWRSLNLKPGAKPVISPEQSNPLCNKTWWKI